MIDSKLRGAFQPLFNNLARALIKLKIQPNTITVIAFLVGLLAGGMIALDYLGYALGFLWLSGLFDVLDGSVARLTGNSSKQGAYMDLIFDRLVESSIILGFYFLYPDYALAYLVFFIAVMFNFTTFLLAGALFNNTGEKSMHYDVGIAERTETFIVFSLMMLFPRFLMFILAAFNGLVFLTGLIRFYRIMKSERR